MSKRGLTSLQIFFAPSSRLTLLTHLPPLRTFPPTLIMIPPPPLTAVATVPAAAVVAVEETTVLALAMNMRKITVVVPVLAMTQTRVVVVVTEAVIPTLILTSDVVDKLAVVMKQPTHFHSTIITTLD